MSLLAVESALVIYPSTGLPERSAIHTLRFSIPVAPGGHRTIALSRKEEISTGAGNTEKAPLIIGDTGFPTGTTISGLEAFWLTPEKHIPIAGPPGSDPIARIHFLLNATPAFYRVVPGAAITTGTILYFQHALRVAKRSLGSFRIARSRTVHYAT